MRIVAVAAAGLHSDVYGFHDETNFVEFLAPAY